MDEKERLIREFYAARARRDWAAARGLLADDVVWHESGSEAYSGDYRGREHVVGLLRGLVEVTGGTFTLEPARFIVTAEHAATNARWSAERGKHPSRGERPCGLCVAEGRIAEAWFSSPTGTTRRRSARSSPSSVARDADLAERATPAYYEWTTSGREAVSHMSAAVPLPLPWGERWP